MNRSSDGSARRPVPVDGIPIGPLGLLSFVRPSHPSLRWHSSSEGRARSLHLALCRTPSSCSGLARPSSAGGSSVGPVSLEILWRRPISRRFSPNDGT
jgi:hypothetical protein